MKVTQALDREHFRSICEMGGQAAVAIARELQERGIDPVQTANVLLVALAGATKKQPPSPDDLHETLSSLDRLWTVLPGGTVELIVPEITAPEELD